MFVPLCTTWSQSSKFEDLWHPEATPRQMLEAIEQSGRRSTGCQSEAEKDGFAYMVSCAVQVACSCNIAPYGTNRILQKSYSN